MTISFVRHGVTDFNKQKRPAGRRFDESLNEEGRNQAVVLTEQIRGEFDVIIASPLKRALETVEPLSRKLNLPIQINEHLTERSHGHLDGKTWDEIALLTEGRMNLAILQSALEHDFSRWGGDNIEDVRMRTKDAVNDIVQKFSGKRVLGMTHGGVIKVLYALSGDMQPRKIANISVHEFDWEALEKIQNVECKM